MAVTCHESHVNECRRNLRLAYNSRLITPFRHQLRHDRTEQQVARNKKCEARLVAFDQGWADTLKKNGSIEMPTGVTPSTSNSVRVLKSCFR
jgi:hypothetical protein